MDTSEAITILAALAQPTRLATFRLLVRHEPEGVPVGEIARLITVPQNTMSTHLSVLSRAGLAVWDRQSRSVIYRANLACLRDLMLFLAHDCCGGNAALCAPLIADLTPCFAPPEKKPMADRIYNVLFLCTGNTARSVLAESILRKDGAGKFHAFSAGSFPKGTVNPYALKVLESFDYPTEGLRSKSWSEFSTPDAPQMDFIFTVCDNAAGEICPIWPGHPMTAHWGIEDPAAAQGTAIQKEAAFVTAFQYLKNRISAFVALPLASIDELVLNQKLRGIGKMDGTTARKEQN